MEFGVQFHPDKFYDQIAQQGVSIKWERASRCGCYDPDTRQPNVSCLFCYGRGWLYSEPYPDDDIKAIISGVTGKKEFMELGGIVVGDCTMTLHPKYRIGERDRISLLESTFRDNMLFIRGESDTFHFPASSLISLIELRQYETLYAVDEDYTLQDGRIVWEEDKGPADGEVYSALYLRHPLYYVYTELPLIRREIYVREKKTTKELPSRCLIRLEQFFNESEVVFG